MDSANLNKIRSSSIRAALLTILTAILMVGSISMLSIQIYKLDRSGAKNTETITKLKTDNERLVPLAAGGLGYKDPSTASAAQISISLSASDLINQIVTLTSSDRSKITIFFFTKDIEQDVNRNILFPRLRELGFSITEEDSELTKTHTNAIWFGSGVDINEAKLVALTLIAAGIHLKSIMFYHDPDHPKKFGIDVGANPSFSKQPDLTPAQVFDSKTFPRNPVDFP